MTFDQEMERALIADGEKLRALTGEDHGPWDMEDGDILPPPIPAIYDKTGREIMVGDVVKVFHFVAAVRRERHYMYKQAIGRAALGRDNPSPYMKFSHLNMDDSEFYYEALDGRCIEHYEIIQGASDQCRDRPRTTSLAVMLS